MSKNMSCCNNPTLAFRSDNDKAMIKQYCGYALSAPTDFYKNYTSKEFFCLGASCGDSSAPQYYGSYSAYQFHPGTMAQGGVSGMCGRK